MLTLEKFSCSSGDRTVYDIDIEWMNYIEWMNRACRERRRAADRPASDVRGGVGRIAVPLIGDSEREVVPAACRSRCDSMISSVGVVSSRRHLLTCGSTRLLVETSQ